MTKTAQNFTFKAGGEAGFGVMATGSLFAKLAVRSGFHIFDYTEYPSLIRGGHNVMQIGISTEPIYAQYSTTDFLLCLNQETLDLHAHELTTNAGVLIDTESKINIKNVNKGNVFEIPLTQMVRDIKGSYVMRNTAAIGAVTALLGGNIKLLENIMDDEFGHKHSDVIEKNYKLCELAYEYVQTNYGKHIINLLGKGHKHIKNQIIITGNDAAAFAALTAGMNFFSVYPMTPTSNIMHTLAPLQEKYNFIYKQPEDEIAAINMAIGASFAGSRAMVATSGGGFCLMTEGLGLAGMTEIPLVVIEGMRGSPATGLPTWTEQGDLRFVLHAHQGEFPRIVIAPGDIEEVFEYTFEAFNLSDIYQTPVIILVDKYLCESHKNTEEFNILNLDIKRGLLTHEKVNDYNRYAISTTGISERTLPGSGNFFVANSDEHNEHGYSIEDSKTRNNQMEKRMNKLKTCEKTHMKGPKVYGPKDADLTIVSWGSNKGPILETLKHFNNVNYIHTTWMSPFPTQELKKLLINTKKLLGLECNYSGQFLDLVKEKTGFEIINRLLKYDGRPFYPEEIVVKVKELL